MFRSMLAVTICWLALVCGPAAVAGRPASAAPSTGAAPPAGAMLRVGTKIAPPFVIKESDGSRTGLAIDLWRRVAVQTGYQSEFHEYDIDGLLHALESGEIDVAVAALTVTTERETRIDFCYPFHTAGLGIAVRAGGGSGWTAAGRALLSPAFFKAVGALALVLLLAGALVWVFERRSNDEQFGGTPVHGLGNSFWWAAVTMTTVGYGDKAPRTLGGRLIALVWMFAGLIIVSGFTAAIASALTVGSLSQSINGVDDLSRRHVGTIGGTTSETWAAERSIDATAYTTVDEALAALADGRVDAVVHDRPILRYLAARMPGRPVEVLPQLIERQDYAFAVAEHGELREPLNRAVLAAIESPDWPDVVEGYLGR